MRLFQILFIILVLTLGLMACEGSKVDELAKEACGPDGVLKVIELNGKIIFTCVDELQEK